MKLKTEKVTFTNGKSLMVSQENWDISMTLSEEQRKALIDPLPDKRLQYFREKIYPLLLAPSSGDVPDLKSAYSMLESAPQDIDNWYKTIQIINPDWFTYLDHNESETVIFSDKSKLTIIDGNVPTGIMRINDLEEEAIAHPSETLNQQVFRSTFYPKLAACSTGNVPTEEEARTMPTAELNKWYEAVNRVNPHWFKSMIDLKDKMDAETQKKKRKKQQK